MTIVFTSLLAGSISGFLYGLFFLYQRRRVFLLAQHGAKKTAFFASAFVGIRMFALIACWYYLLLSTPINLILLLFSFLGIFWLTILTKKA